jgi:peroxiredoxin
MPKLSAGDTFPDFEFHTAKGETRTVLEVIRNRKKTVFWLLRYIGCTSCRYDIQTISEKYQKFLDLDTQVLVVLQSPPETIREEEGAHSFPMEIICDPEFEIYNRFSVASAPDKAGLQPTEPAEVKKMRAKRERIQAAGIVHGKYEGNELQLPALFVVDKNASVLYARYAKIIADMPTADELLEKLGACLKT